MFLITFLQLLFYLSILYCLLWQVIVWPPPLPIPSLSIVLIHAEQESPVFWSLSNSSLLSQVATRTARKCLSSPWRHVAEMYILAPRYHSEVRCDLLWPINISSTCVSSKWWFMNQCIMWPSSVPGTTVWAHSKRSIHLPGPQVSRCSRGGRKRSCSFHGLHKPNTFLPVQVLSFIQLIIASFFICLASFILITN